MTNRKVAKKQIMKKPSAAKSSAEVTLAVNQQGFAPLKGSRLETPLVLADFVSEVMQVLGVRRSESQKAFHLATACTGSSSQRLCCKLKSWVAEAWRLRGMFSHWIVQVWRPHSGAAIHA